MEKLIREVRILKIYAVIFTILCGFFFHAFKNQSSKLYVYKNNQTPIENLDENGNPLK
ncbi:hypothetical protein [Chryseobacterium sp. Marseille-Q8038]